MSTEQMGDTGMIADFCRRESIRIESDYPLRDHTTFRIGGCADFAVFPKREEEVASLVSFFRREKIRFFVLGKGSDLLADDAGFRGVLLSTADMDGCVLRDERIEAQAGVSLAALSNFAAVNGLGGMEFLHGIPGSLGGGIFMNAGAYGGEISQLVERVTFVDADGAVRTCTGEEADFSYRHSLFSDSFSVICSAVLKPISIEKPDEIRRKIAELDARRREKQPLEYPSAGSAFKRPEGYFAAKLIEDCGLKGLRIGDAQVSEKHAGFIVNRGSATAAQVRALMASVTETVREKTGVVLEPEIRFLGVDSDGI